MPSRGLGYGVIRYLLSDEVIRDRLSSMPRAEVAFNYTGHGGHGHGRGANESEAPSLEDIGQIILSQSAKRPRQHLFEIVAGVAKGRLVVRWGYSADTYAKETVAHVSERFLQNLRWLLARLDENSARESRDTNQRSSTFHPDRLLESRLPVEASRLLGSSSFSSSASAFSNASRYTFAVALSSPGTGVIAASSGCFSTSFMLFRTAALYSTTASA